MTNEKGKLRVLQIIPPVGIGGAERLVVDLAKDINRDKFFLGVCALGKKMEKCYEKELIDNGVPYFFLNTKGAFNPMSLIKLTGLLRQFKPDVIHTHLKAIRYALLPSLLCSVPAHIHTIHSLAKKETSFPFHRLLNTIAFRVLKVKPVSVSQAVALSVKKVYGIDSTVIYNGIPTAIYSKRDTKLPLQETIYVMSVGRFKRAKNHLLLLEAFHRAVSEEPRLRLGLVGDGELRQKIEEKARELGLSDKVDFLGWREDIPELLSNCDIFVLSSDWEGFPTSVLEAMAAGKPIVATMVGGLPEVVIDGLTGLLVPPRNADALAKAILKLVRDVESRMAMGGKGKERVTKKFDISLTVQGYEQLYKDELSKKELWKRKSRIS